MSGEIRYPNITATDEKSQLLQVKSYLHQLVDQLNFAMGAINSAGTGMTYANSGKNGAVSAPKEDPADTWGSIKALIIKSADIVDAYYEQINTRLEGLYVAESDFGTFTEKTAQDIKANSEAISQVFADVQTVDSKVKEISDSVAAANAYIKSGLLYYDENGLAVFGVEIGQQNTVDGEEVFNKFARFTASKLSFYDQNGNEVAWVSDKQLYIRNVYVTASFRIGGLKDTVLSGGSIVTKWVGTGG